jgi:hypothetical protein
LDYHVFTVDGGQAWGTRRAVAVIEGGGSEHGGDFRDESVAIDAQGFGCGGADNRRRRTSPRDAAQSEYGSKTLWRQQDRVHRVGSQGGTTAVRGHGG